VQSRILTKEEVIISLGLLRQQQTGNYLLQNNERRIFLFARNQKYLPVFQHLSLILVRYFVEFLEVQT